MSLQSPALLAIFAHPDDEAFRCGETLELPARRGVRVQVLTATRGQAGSCGDPPICRPEELAGVRERELNCACAALGIAPPRLLDYQDGELATLDEEKAVAQIVGAMRQVQPDVLLTWPPDGLPGHPDQCAVSRWASQAFVRASDLGADAPMALYQLAVPASLAGALGLTALDAMPDAQISLAVDVEPVWERKLAAIRCHRTQAGHRDCMAPLEVR